MKRKYPRKSFKVNSVVRLKKYKRQAKIEVFYIGMGKGAVRLDRKLQNHWSWNTENLEVVPSKERKI